MPTRTRAGKSTKALKENIIAPDKGKLKPGTKAKNLARQVLADKTNSASDDNETIIVPKKGVTKASVVSKVFQTNNKDRPRRDRRLPSRFVENHVLINLSNSKDNASLTVISRDEKSQTSVKSADNSVEENSFKTPVKTIGSPLLAARPKRVCRLPSKFEDHSVSPSKFISAPPVHASTPMVLNKVTNSKYKAEKSKHTKNNPNKSDLDKNTSGEKVVGKIVKHSSDSNNNANQGRSLRARKVDAKTKGNKKKKSINSTTQNKSASFTKASPTKATLNSKSGKSKNFSFRVLENKKQSENEDRHNLDVYEFTFDPNEEPPPQKKKKKVVRKKAIKPKAVVFKSNYNLNLSKALSALKTTVSDKSAQKAAANTPSVQNSVSISSTNKDVSVVKQTASHNNDETNINKNKHVSIRVEDIAADFQSSLDQADINYSPVNSPMRPITPTQPSYREDSNHRPDVHDDPLNLKENLSCFDDQPVASSSMNMSAKHSHASPWRVEFGNLPIRWHANSYTKQNMTPAVECSFINFDENKKKHVYTDIVPHVIESLQDLVNSKQQNLKQTSIISFYKERAEMSTNKKREKSKTPIKSYIFDDLIKTTANKNDTPRKVVTPRKVCDKNSLTPKSDTDKENISFESGEENTRGNLKRKNENELNMVPAKTPHIDNDNDNTFFGFNDSEDVENISPKKVINQKAQSLRPRARAVLKEINKQAGPTRAVVPFSATAKSNSEVVSKLYEIMKSAEAASVLPEKEEENVEVTNAEEQIYQDINENSDSVHLFEDIELIHNLKAHRKSYGKAKKVAFRQRSISSSDTQDSEIAKKAVESNDEGDDDLYDLTFEMPATKQKRKKKTTKKQKQSKKVDEEAEEWAAGFNSMCKEVDEFPLPVE